MRIEDRISDLAMAIEHFTDHHGMRAEILRDALLPPGAQ
jgi:hypothetical protein